MPVRSGVHVTAGRNRSDADIVPGKVRGLAASTSAVSQRITAGLVAAFTALRSPSWNLALPTQPTARFIRRLYVIVARADSRTRRHQLRSSSGTSKHNVLVYLHVAAATVGGLRRQVDARSLNHRRVHAVRVQAAHALHVRGA